MYKYETHLHTSQGSACGHSTGAEMARAHKEQGYTGIFVTDHFFNGNSAVDRKLPWKEKIELFCKGYEDAKEEGDKIGLDVFFGLEYGVTAAEFLMYNIDKQFLLDCEDFDKWNPKKAFDAVHEAGGFIVHAHPFRERDYIDHIKLFPRHVDGVEAINGAHFDHLEFNDRAIIYARMYDLPVTAGSDTHSTRCMYGSGVETPEKIVVPLDYLRLMKEGKLTLRDSTM